MSTVLLNLESIRGATIRPADRSLSRREFLGSALFAAARPLLHYPQPFVFLHDRHQFLFEIDDYRWHVDARWFLGGRLEVVVEPDAIVVSLKDALFPGTPLKAGFDARVARRLGGWFLDIRPPLSARRVSVPFEEWLRREAHITTSPAARSFDVAMAAPRALRALDLEHLDYAASGVSTLRGVGGVRISMAGVEWIADGLSLESNGQAPDTILAAPEQVTRVAFHRGTQTWSLNREGRWRDSCPSAISCDIDALRAEVTNGSVGLMGQANTASFVPGDDVLGEAGEPAGLRMTDFRLAIASARTGSTELFARAHFDPGTASVKAFGIALQLSGSASHPFELHDVDGRSTLDARLRVAAIPVALGRDVFARLHPGIDAALDLSQRSATAEQNRQTIDRAMTSPVRSLDLVRASDLLVLTLVFTNLTMRWRRERNAPDPFGDPSRQPELVPYDATQPSYLTVEFPPQHLEERAFYEAETTTAPPSEQAGDPGSVEARLAGPSRLVFAWPSPDATLPLTVDALLDWSRLEPHVVSSAVPRGEMGATPATIGTLDTAIEFPRGLLLSPNRRSGWSHTVAPRDRLVKKANGSIRWTELWHTKLGVRAGGHEIDEVNEYYRTLRAIDVLDRSGSAQPPSADCTPGATEPQAPMRTAAGRNYRVAMDRNDQFEIVHLSSDFAWTNGGPLLPAPIQADRFFLSAMGAVADLSASWQAHPQFSVREWRQITTLGRDQYVRIVYGGYLYPFGHRANVIQITERKFQRRQTGGPIVAVLRQTRYITIEEPIKTFGETGIVIQTTGASLDRMMPMASVEVTTTTTPRLDDYPQGAANRLRAPCAFWPKVGGRELAFDFRAIDLAGRTRTFSSPAIFVRYSSMHDPAFVRGTVTPEWNGSPFADVPFSYQRVAFAPVTSADDTSLDAATLRFEAHYEEAAPVASQRQPVAVVASLEPCVPADNVEALQALAAPGCRPIPRRRAAPRPSPANLHVPRARVRIPAATSIAPSAARDLDFGWHPDYLKHGFDPKLNIGEVFGKFPTVDFSLPSTRSVGLFRPDFPLEGVSRRFGGIGDVDGILKGDFNPSAFFKDAGKLFGLLDISKVIQQVNLSGAADRVPRVNTETLYDANGLPERIRATMQWKSPLKKGTFGPVSIDRLTSGDPALELSIRVETATRSAATHSIVLGELRAFSLEIASAVRVEFESMRFTSTDGSKPTVDVKVKTVAFLGALDFFAKLASLLPKGLFGQQGPQVALEGTTIVAKMALRMPDVGLGVFSLMHLRFDAALELPLIPNRSLTLRVAFGGEHDPFLVAVTLLGGGGHQILRLDANGVAGLDAAIQFGGVVSINLVVASGSAYILAGLGIVYERNNTSTLRAFFRAGACLSVLGLLTVSIEFSMALEFELTRRVLTGTCTVIVSISILFFSIDVPVTLSYSFAVGGRGTSRSLSSASAENVIPRHTFGDMMSRSDWQSYCQAFSA